MAAWRFRPLPGSGAAGGGSGAASAHPRMDSDAPSPGGRRGSTAARSPLLLKNRAGGSGQAERLAGLGAPAWLGSAPGRGHTADSALDLGKPPSPSTPFTARAHCSAGKRQPSKGHVARLVGPVHQASPRRLQSPRRRRDGQAQQALAPRYARRAQAHHRAQRHRRGRW